MPLRSTIRSLIPRRVLDHYHSWRTARVQRSVDTARRAFETVTHGPNWLDETAMRSLLAQYTIPASYGYDPSSLEQRGNDRAADMRTSLPQRGASDVLELACLDGMTARALQLAGNTCHAIDLNAKGFDPRALDAGVRFHRMDAAKLTFPDASFDLVFSYNGFEHFTDPDAVLHEALRVTRPGGYIHLRFGPVYGSAKGMHAYTLIPVPYSQYLFPLELMNAYLRSNGKGTIDPDHCNRWSVRQFRSLWEQVNDQAEIVVNKEFTYMKDLDLVLRYPSCFRSKTEHFEDLIVNILHVVLRKR